MHALTAVHHHQQQAMGFLLAAFLTCCTQLSLLVACCTQFPLLVVCKRSKETTPPSPPTLPQIVNTHLPTVQRGLCTQLEIRQLVPHAPQPSASVLPSLTHPQSMPGKPQTVYKFPSLRQDCPTLATRGVYYRLKAMGPQDDPRSKNTR